LDSDGCVSTPRRSLSPADPAPRRTPQWGPAPLIRMSTAAPRI
jgi:hypothetical protein